MSESMDAHGLRKMMFTKIAEKAKEMCQLMEGIAELPAVELERDELNDLIDLAVNEEWNGKTKRVVFKTGSASGWVELRCPINVKMRKI